MSVRSLSTSLESNLNLKKREKRKEKKRSFMNIQIKNNQGQKYIKKNFPLEEKFFGFAEKSEKFFKKFFRTKKKGKKNPSNFSRKSGGYF